VTAKKKPPKIAEPKKSRARTPPHATHPDWSSAKFWAFVRSGLRSTYNKWPPKWEVLKAAKRAYEGEKKQQKWEYQCACCKEWFPQKEISVDHIVPAGSLNSYDDLPGFVERLFVGVEGLQVLCKADHDKKTKEDKIK
jgi:hypothetical protein